MSHEFLRKREVLQRTGLSHAALYRLIRAGEFPKQVLVGQRAVRWSSLEIDAWMAGRLQMRGAA
jgi:prophage regulatory protein